MPLKKSDGGIVKCMEAGKSDCHSHYAKGGDVDEMEDHEDMEMKGDVDSELMDMVADELAEAIEKKDKKGIVEAIKAIVMSCKE